MKKLLTVALLAVGMTVFAQERKKEEPVSREVKVLERFKDLNLSKDQEQKVLELYKNKKAERKSETVSMTDSKPSKEEMIARREKMNGELKNILSEEQYIKFQQMKKERAKMKNKK